MEHRGGGQGPPLAHLGQVDVVEVKVVVLVILVELLVFRPQMIKHLDQGGQRGGLGVLSRWRQRSGGKKYVRYETTISGA